MTTSRFNRAEAESRRRTNAINSMVAQAAHFIVTYPDGCDLVLVTAQNNQHVAIGMRSPMNGERLLRLGHFTAEDSIAMVKSTIQAAIDQQQTAIRQQSG